jgi:predicted DNA-binding transcriptional regulator YafY
MSERRNVQAVRLLRLAKRLDGCRFTPPLAQLADEFGVCARTIRRDLHTLEEAGWPVPQFRYHACHVQEMRVWGKQARYLSS